MIWSSSQVFGRMVYYELQVTARLSMSRRTVLAGLLRRALLRLCTSAMSGLGRIRRRGGWTGPIRRVSGWGNVGAVGGRLDVAGACDGKGLRGRPFLGLGCGVGNSAVRGLNISMTSLAVGVGRVGGVLMSVEVCAPNLLNQSTAAAV